jgi:hypothetical protein
LQRVVDLGFGIIKSAKPDTDREEALAERGVLLPLRSPVGRC